MAEREVPLGVNYPEKQDSSPFHHTHQHRHCPVPVQFYPNNILITVKAIPLNA
jgi:hypothetical protein